MPSRSTNYMILTPPGTYIPEHIDRLLCAQAQSEGTTMTRVTNTTTTFNDDTNQVTVVETKEQEIFDGVLSDDLVHLIADPSYSFDFKVKTVMNFFGLVRRDEADRVVRAVKESFLHSDESKKTIDEYSEPEDQYYSMNPKTDDLVPTGNLLEPGMIVLVESTIVRGPDEPTYDFDRMKRSNANRWCQVLGPIEIDRKNKIVSFTGLYHNGEKTRRTYGLSHAWIVKKDSLPDDHTSFTDK